MLVAIHSPLPVKHPAQFANLRRPPGRANARGLAGLFDVVDSAIQTVEGWFPGSVSYRLNNPGNLMFAGQPGAVPHPIVGSDGTTRVFAEFPTASAGQQALDNQVALDASRGLTISQFAAKYAPAQDSNDPASYAARIAAAAGLSVNDPLSLAGGSAVASASVPAVPDTGIPTFTVDAFGTPLDAASAPDLTPVLWAALAVGGVLYAVASS